MPEIVRTWLDLRTDRRGVTMLEYGLIAALIAVVCIAGVKVLGTDLNTTFNTVAASVNSTNGSGG